jgi:SAM-dependent methyltransferase
VWPAGPAPIDLDASWPTPIVSKIVTSFSTPGGRVVLLPWPTPQPAPGERRGLSVVGADGVIDHAPAADPDSDNEVGGELAAALAAVKSLDRNGRMVRIAAEENLTGPASRPFWADLVGDPDHTPASPASRPGLDGSVLDGPDDVSPDSVNSADLIITSLRPEHRNDVTGDHASDLVALVAARLLRVGGILAVLTHCYWPQGELIDPTGAVVASAQNADLLYLQHIIALHVPVRGGRFATELLTNVGGTADRATNTAITSAAAEQQARAAHRAAVRGLPAPHRRVHSDVLVFAQPHEYEPLSVSSAEQALDSDVIR